jgi:hypothetical protein
VNPHIIDFDNAFLSFLNKNEVVNVMLKVFGVGMWYISPYYSHCDKFAICNDSTNSPQRTIALHTKQYLKCSSNYSSPLSLPSLQHHQPRKTTAIQHAQRHVFKPVTYAAESAMAVPVPVTQVSPSAMQRRSRS